MIRRRVLISGRVQGVAFRDTCQRMATEQGVAGWVRNLGDGRVEAVFEGPAEQDDRRMECVHEGPRLADIVDIAVQSEPAQGLTGFVVH